MNDSNEIDEIIDRIKIGKYTEADVDILYRLSRSGDRETISQLGKYNVNIGEGKDIQIGDRIYQQWDEKSIEALVKAIQVNSGIHQNTQGGDAAAGDIDKSTTNINIFQFFLPDYDPSNCSPTELSVDFSGVPQKNIQEAYQGLLNPDNDLWNLSGNEVVQKLMSRKEPGQLYEFFNRLIEDENLPKEIRRRLQLIAKQLSLKKPIDTTEDRSSQRSNLNKKERDKSYLIATIVPKDDKFLLNALLITHDPFQTFESFQLQDLQRFKREHPTFYLAIAD
jgi:hypothetical protein